MLHIIVYIRVRAIHFKPLCIVNSKLMTFRGFQIMAHEYYRVTKFVVILLACTHLKLDTLDIYLLNANQSSNIGHTKKKNG